MSSGFITESEAIEVRKKRQEEWERVRKSDDPIERPEIYESRSLYERLQEQKQKKDLEYEEAHKLKNMIKGLDDDEIEFLDLVDRTKLAADRIKCLEEEKELNDYRNRVATLQEQTLDSKLHSEVTGNNKPKVSNTNRKSQMTLLQGVVVKKRKLSDTESSDAKGDESPATVSKHAGDGNTGLRCIGILPGLGYYNDSSSEDSDDSDTDVETKSTTDFLGRKIVQKEVNDD